MEFAIHVNENARMVLLLDFLSFTDPGRGIRYNRAEEHFDDDESVFGQHYQIEAIDFIILKCFL